MSRDQSGLNTDRGREAADQAGPQIGHDYRRVAILEEARPDPGGRADDEQQQKRRFIDRAFDRHDLARGDLGEPVGTLPGILAEQGIGHGQSSSVKIA